MKEEIRCVHCGKVIYEVSHSVWVSMGKRPYHCQLLRFNPPKTHSPR